MDEKIFRTRSPAQTRAVAARLARDLPPRATLALHGPLGSGKTCFVQGLAEALSIAVPVTSPTFTVVNEYRADRLLVHIDLYRVRTADEALSLGLDEYLETDAVTAIEWPERIAELLPAHTIHIRFEPGASPSDRTIRITR
jgi:tRNA threonylcarbamoyladenosine biosynthesis protein TsaE